MADLEVKLSSLPDDSSVGGAEKLLALDGTTTKVMTVFQVATYTSGVLAAAAAVDPGVAGDDLLVFRSGTAKTLDIDDMVDYVDEAQWGQGVASPVVTGDKLTMRRSTTDYTITVDALATFVLAGAQANALDISGLDAATLGASDQYLVVQGSAAKKTTLTALETKLWADLTTHVIALTAVTTPADADKLALIQGTTEKYVTLTVLAGYMATETGATILASAWDADTVTSAATGDMLLLERSDVLKQIDVDDIVDYAATTLAASAAVDPVVAGDDVLAFRSGVAKTIDVDVLSTYVLANTWDAATITEPTGTDKVLIAQSGMSKQVTVANLGVTILDGIQADVLDISGLSAATLAAGDEYLVCQTGTAAKTTLTALETKLWADFATYVAARSDATTLADGDILYVINSGAPKYTTPLEISTYTTTKLLAAAAVSPVLTGDKLLVNRSNVLKQATVDDLVTYVSAGTQSTILNISGLTAATLGSSDTMLVCQSTTAKKTTIADLETKLWTDYTAYVVALDAVATTVAGDLIPCIQGGAAKYVTPAVLATYIESALTEAAADIYAERWKVVAASSYTATPASTSQITMSDTSDMLVGLPVRYTYGGVAYYGIITTISANSYVRIAGVALNIAIAISELAVGLPEQVEQVDFTIAGSYATTAQDILATVGNRYFKWAGAAAYLVAFSATHKTADTGASQPKVNVKVNSQLVSTNDSTNGLQLSTAGTWVDNSVVAISATYYAIARGNAVEVRCTVAGTNTNAANLTVSCTFVYA